MKGLFCFLKGEFNIITKKYSLDEQFDKIISFSEFSFGKTSASFENFKLNLIKVALENLTERQRECFMQKIIKNKKAKEIAKEMGLSVPTVYKHIRLAKKQIHNFSDTILHAMNGMNGYYTLFKEE